jgi:hypothetical protein
MFLLEVSDSGRTKVLAAVNGTDTSDESASEKLMDMRMKSMEQE